MPVAPNQTDIITVQAALGSKTEIRGSFALEVLHLIADYTDKTSILTGVSLHVGTGAPSGTLSGKVVTPAAIYFRTNGTLDTVVYVTADTGTTWSSIGPQVSGGAALDVAGENLVAGDVLYVKSADGRLWKHAGTELQAAAIVGLCTGTFATAATGVTWYGPGDIMAIAAGKTAGDELYAKEDGLAVTIGNVVATNYTRRLGSVLGGGLRLQVSLGMVFQKSA